MNLLFPPPAVIDANWPAENIHTLAIMFQYGIGFHTDSICIVYNEKSSFTQKSEIKITCSALPAFLQLHRLLLYFQTPRNHNP